MSDWVEVLIWCLGFFLLHEGIARSVQRINDRKTFFAVSFGVLTLLSGTIFWYQSARGYEQLYDTQLLHKSEKELKVRIEKFEELEPPQRSEASVKLAKLAFANGEDDLKVFSEEGGWTPFKPDVQDWKERDLRHKMLTEMNQRRQDLLLGLVTAERDWKKWFASLLIGILTGLMGGYSRRKTIDIFRIR
ncbi:hypothetical protein [Acidovorax sp.]|uniref:hypothetical protein n=1 Tax=Acidovorax sp. TaxID=1872122 RepID=UPI0025B96394|nr:hypothetical protein [Acidovorax sp.]MBW8462816.1 hypothetical protein [Acidovorax sp.]